MEHNIPIELSSDSEDECQKEDRKSDAKQAVISLLSDSEEDNVKSNDSESICYFETTKRDQKCRIEIAGSQGIDSFVSNKKRKPILSLHKGKASPDEVTSYEPTKVSTNVSSPTGTSLDFSCGIKDETKTSATSLTKQKQYVQSFHSFTMKLKKKGKDVRGALRYLKNLERAIAYFEESPVDWKELGESQWSDPVFDAKVKSIHTNVKGVGEATVLLFAWLARSENENRTDFQFKHGDKNSMVFSCDFCDFRAERNK